MSEWKSKLNFGEPTHVEHKVGEATVKFYPVSVGMMFKLRRAAKPIAKAISVLTSGGGKDTGNIFREVGEPVMLDGKPLKLKDGQGGDRIVRDNETIAEAITPELAETRTRQRSEAIEDLIGALTDDENVKIIAEIIMDSMRMEGNDRPPASEFINQIELPILGELLMGVGKANKGVFGPLADKLSPAFTQAQGAIKARLSSEGSESSESDPSQTPTESGKTSPIASSSSESEATT